MHDINENAFIPQATAKWLRAIKRLILSGYRRELEKQITHDLKHFNPDVIVMYKGSNLRPEFLCALKSSGRPIVNIYPDCSPHAHGKQHNKSLGLYDLVISTKPFHQPNWSTVYGYDNPCAFVPQGYDPSLHLFLEPPKEKRFDVILVATWRREYHLLMKEIARILGTSRISFGVGGNGWVAHKNDYPANWEFFGPVQGRNYVATLRQGRICLAPVQRDMIVDGQIQPGDVDSTRTYELAAAHVFFIHSRNEYVTQVYEEESEVPMFDSATELADKIAYFLARPEVRAQMSESAFRRAVPNYSLDTRAKQILCIIEKQFALH